MKTNKNSVRRSLIVSATALVLTVAMLIGTTFAWFTDSVTSGTNKIVAGNLKIAVQYAKQSDVKNETIDESDWKDLEGSTDLFDSNPVWEPGHTELVYLRIKNEGNLALNYGVNVSPIDEIGGVNKAGDSFKLSDYLVFGTTTPDKQLKVYDRASARTVAGDTMGLNQTGLKQTGKLSGSDNDYYYTALVIYMPENVGNVANYGSKQPSIDFKVTVYATQAEEESDSFGTDYDKDAKLYPENQNKDNLDYTYTAQAEKTATITRGDNNTITGVDGGELANDIITITAKDNTGAEVATATIPTTAVANDAEQIVVSVEPTDKPDDVTVTTGEQDAKAVEVKVTGITNSELVKVKFFVGKNLQNLKMYHVAELMDSKESLDAVTANNSYYYDAATGYVTIAVTNFSPFTAVFDAPAVAVNNVGYPTLADAVTAAKTGDTITLLKDITVDKGITAGSSKKNITFDGQGHTIIAPSGNDTHIFTKVYDWTFKNFTANLRGGWICEQVFDDTIFDHVNITGNCTIEQNEGAYVVYANFTRTNTSVTFNDCVSTADLVGGSSDTDYCAIFIGYAVYSRTEVITHNFNFTNCINKGKMISVKAAMFLGNIPDPTHLNINLNVNNCYNDGLIQATHVETGWKPSQFVGVNWENDILKLNLNGMSYNGRDLAYDKVAIPSTDGEVHYISGPLDPTLAITMNSDGTFKVTPATAENVDHYVVTFSIYSYIVPDGTQVQGVAEKIMATDTDKLNSTSVKNLTFVDSEYLTDKSYSSVESDWNIGEASVVSVGNEQYYLIREKWSNYSCTLKGNPKTVQVVSVSAFDANGKLVASSSLSK